MTANSAALIPQHRGLMHYVRGTSIPALAGCVYPMFNEVAIKSSRSAGELKLSDPKPPGSRHPVEYLRVSLKDKDIAASSARVYIYEPHSLASLFEDLAANWKGWQGVKQWHSVEEDFALSCTSDRLGHVVMEVTLKSVKYEDDWCVKAVIHVEFGQLEEIAAKVKQFLHVRRAS
jgi:hypothetical protein